MDGLLCCTKFSTQSVCEQIFPAKFSTEVLGVVLTKFTFSYKGFLVVLLTDFVEAQMLVYMNVFVKHNVTILI